MHCNPHATRVHGTGVHRDSTRFSRCAPRCLMCISCSHSASDAPPRRAASASSRSHQRVRLVNRRWLDGDDSKVEPKDGVRETAIESKRADRSASDKAAQAAAEQHRNEKLAVQHDRTGPQRIDHAAAPAQQEDAEVLRRVLHRDGCRGPKHGGRRQEEKQPPLGEEDGGPDGHVHVRETRHGAGRDRPLVRLYGWPPGQNRRHRLLRDVDDGVRDGLIVANVRGHQK
mmetsp:Transcript_26063/g.69015  ORF Transcript_26063/g.69015 Transcript_26063/m.69015 type:complete len:228 (-) Transcript_26063:83-766(-)